jgi:hypothetical protein
MSTTTKRRDLGQARLGDLTFWILGAAVFFAMIRGATGFWGNPVPMLDTYRVVGVGLLAVAAVVIGRLTADAMGQTNSAKSTFGRIWRLGAVALLSGLAIAESVVLRDDGSGRGRVIVDWPPKLVAIALTIGLIGVLLGVIPTRPTQPQRRSGALSIVFAGAAGLLILTAMEMMVPYLVLIAMEAVRIAMFRPGQMADHIRSGHPIDRVFIDASRWTSLHIRLRTAGAWAAIALIVCGLTAHWLGRDLRDPVRRLSRMGLCYRVATALATWGMGLYLMFVALPTLQPWLAEGIWNVIEPGGSSVIAAGFIALAAGIAARGVGGPASLVGEEMPRGSWQTRMIARIFQSVLAVVAVMVFLAAVSKIRGDQFMPWYVPYSLGDWLAIPDRAMTIATPTAIYFNPGKNPDVFALLGGVGVILMHLPRFLLHRDASEAPVDRIAGQPRQIGRFLAAWFVISGVMFTLFSSFVLGGLALIHYCLKLS